MSDTPETESASFYQPSDRHPDLVVDADFAKNLERQINMLLDALERIAYGDIFDVTMKEIAFEAIASVKQVSPYVGKES
jgi:hypothetical protein